VIEGDVILTQIPQSDGTLKTRPALVLRELPPFRDLLVCGISTQTHQSVPGFDERIVRTDSDFKKSGLLADSVVRLGFLAVLPRTKIAGTIGKISRHRYERLVKRLSSYLIKKIVKTSTK
jgi:mRNA interferase MazF